MGVKFFVLFLLTLCGCYVVTSEKHVVCYYGTWATYRSGNGKFDVDNVNPDLCTHLMYAFVGIDNQGNVISLDSYLDLGRDNFGEFNALKQKNPKLKTILAVGGWNEGSGKYSTMAADATFRNNFISSALDMVLTYGFDGFDLDWEYPARRDTVYGQADVDNFTKLVKELKEEFQKYGLQVTAAVSSVAEMSSLSYDISSICQYLDIVNLMTYDFYGAWDPTTGHNAALHKGEGDEATPRESLYTVDVAVEYWLGQGCPSEKLVIGLPFYGRTFTLTDANVNGVRAPASGAGIAGPITLSAGSLGYNEFCNILQSQSGWEIHYDELAEVPYAVQGRNWVSYDDANSITKKVEWGLEKNVGGFMVWSIETDDFNGICGEDYPLLKAINKALGKIDGEEATTDDNEDVDTTVTTEDATITATTEAVTITTEFDTTSTDAATVTSPTEHVTVTTEVVTTFTEASTTETEITTTEASATTAQETESSTDLEDLNSACVTEGIISNPFDCTKFLMCIRDNNGDLYAVVFECPNDTRFDQSILACNYANLVKCTI